MGNNIGFQIESQRVKLAYVDDDPENISFMKGLKSRFLFNSFNQKQATVFLFQCSIEEFLKSGTSENISKIRKQFNSVLSNRVSIKTNRQTMNKMARNSKLQEALRMILIRDFQLVHKERIERTAESFNLLQSNDPFFSFSSLIKINQLHFPFQNLEKKLSRNIDDQCLMVVLRNGMTLYKLEKKGKVERIGGSIIGQKTIFSILKFKFPGKTLQEIFQIAMNLGNLKNTDMMVEDIYGRKTDKLGLDPDLIASCLGKIGKMSKQELALLKQQDIARSLITAFAINVASITSAFLNPTSINQAFILADTFHDDRFYCLIQSIFSIFAPGKQMIFCNYSPFIGCIGSALEK